MSEPGSSAKLGTQTKFIAAGVSAVATLVLSYFVYSRFIKKKRSGSSSSESGDDTALLQSLRRENSP